MVTQEDLDKFILSVQELLRLFEQQEKELEKLQKKYNDVVKRNAQLRNEVEFYKSAHQEQLQNSLTLADELEDALEKLEEATK
jgi:hypothetical protein